MMLDFAGLAAALSIRVRSSSAAVVMERAALLRAMSALDNIEQDWRSELARASKQADGGLMYATLEEMLGIDVLLRTWAAFVAASIDAGRQPLRTQHSAGMLTRVLLQQRKRLLTRVIASDLDEETLRLLDRHRRVCERWSDVLLSVFPATATARALQFSHDRSRDFADLWPSPEICLARTADPVIVTAMKSALPAIQLSEHSRGAVYQQLADAIGAALRYDRRTLRSALRANG